MPLSNTFTAEFTELIFFRAHVTGIFGDFGKSRREISGRRVVSSNNIFRLVR